MGIEEIKKDNIEKPVPDQSGIDWEKIKTDEKKALGHKFSLEDFQKRQEMFRVVKALVYTVTDNGYLSEAKFISKEKAEEEWEQRRNSAPEKQCFLSSKEEKIIIITKDDGNGEIQDEEGYLITIWNKGDEKIRDEEGHLLVNP